MGALGEWAQVRTGGVPIRGVPGRDHFFIGPLRVRPDHVFVDVELDLNLTWEQTRRYDGSKLYWRTDPALPFGESECICFWIPRNGERQRVRLLLPESARAAGWIKLRFDPVPLVGGVAEVHRCRLASANDGDEASSTAAALDALKRQTRAAVAESEATGRTFVPHYPESLSFELQPGCNLTCPHCSAHGSPPLHQHHNSLGEMDSALLAKMAHEVFPYLSSVCVVGRGEPLLASDKLWGELLGYLRRYRVLITIMTNGCFVERRITEEVLPLIDTLVVSIDGLTPATFAKNRRGASFEQVLAGVRRFHALRERLCLPRRPKLCISWTLKKNNIAEFPDFVRFIAALEPDRFGVRHLLLFHENQREESLLDMPETANRHLREAYELLAEHGIETDCPPLFEVGPAAPGASDSADGQAAATCAAADGGAHDRACIYIHRTGCFAAGGEMSTCGGPHVAHVGDLAAAPDFWSLWNGPTMQAVRRDLNTLNEWPQCRDCWYRQSRYHAQRQARAAGHAYSLSQGASFSREAWDFRGR